MTPTNLTTWIRTGFDYSNSQAPTTVPNPLYYSVICGFYDVVKHLAIKYRYIKAISGKYKLQLFAAINEDHLDLAELLEQGGGGTGIFDIQSYFVF